jgi:hypothetical protein
VACTQMQHTFLFCFFAWLHGKHGKLPVVYKVPDLAGDWVRCLGTVGNSLRYTHHHEFIK